MKYTYLALGDSYTIGEALPLIHSFPYLTLQRLRKEGINIGAPEVVARTGWTTDELLAAMQDYRFEEDYNFVSLLIGVNNQYRGYVLDTYRLELESLLQQAIRLAGNKSQNVVVLSIPDYSVTPFAKDKDVAKIEKEIEAFNKAKYAIATAFGVRYINITESTQQAKNDVHLLAGDGLHPSAAEYNKWAQLLAHQIKSVLT